MSFDKEMQKALEVDREKLRQLTGEDHGQAFLAEKCPFCGVRLNPQLYPCFENPCPVRAPETWKDCEVCGGEGGFEKHIWVYEHGCGFGHDDSMWVTCEVCNGTGGTVHEAEGDCYENHS